MKEKELPGWLETLYNTNPGLAERAEKYIDTVWNEAVEAAAESADVTTVKVPSALSDNYSYTKFVVDKQSILKLKR